MSADPHQERADALAALREPDAAESTVAAHPTTAHPVAPAPPRGPHASTVVAGGGLLAALVYVDQALQQHGTTLADLTVRSGPLLGSLVANWPIVGLLVYGLLKVHRRWQDHVEWTHQRAAQVDAHAARQDRHAKAQVRAIQAVAAEIEHLRGDLSTEARERQALAGRVSAVEADVRDLQRRVPN